MRNIMQKAGVALFVLISLFLIWFGSLYATVNEPLWFHDAAVPDGAKQAVRPLYFALMKLIGGASLGLGALGLFITATEIRRGSAMTTAALAVAYIIPLVEAAIAAENLANAGAPTSWRLMGALIFLTVLAALLCLASLRNGASQSIERPV